MRFWRALDLGADGVGGLRGDDAAVVCKDGEAPRSGKYEVAIGEGSGQIEYLAMIGQLVSVDSVGGMGCEQQPRVAIRGKSAYTIRWLAQPASLDTQSTASVRAYRQVS